MRDAHVAAVMSASAGMVFRKEVETTSLLAVLVTALTAKRTLARSSD
jgi:hypothetical protein